jgi:hypothetical protein
MVWKYEPAGGRRTHQLDTPVVHTHVCVVVVVVVVVVVGGYNR